LKCLTAYTDTSVFGGVFDDEFKTPSRAFFDLAQSGRLVLVVSDVSRQEVALAPRKVRALFESMLPFMRLVPVDSEVFALRDAYVSAGVVGARRADDAAHVAAATIAGADVIVSWNFRHMVHVEKIRAYNEVNASRGHRAIDIRSPLEVIEYEDEGQDI